MSDVFFRDLLLHADIVFLKGSTRNKLYTFYRGLIALNIIHGDTNFLMAVRLVKITREKMYPLKEFCQKHMCSLVNFS